MFGKFNEEKHAVSEERQRYLAFGSILLIWNGESVKTFKVKAGEKDIKMMLREAWGIEDHNEAKRTCQYLSTADGHTPFADDIYREFIKKKQPAPITPSDLHNKTGLEQACLATIKRQLYFVVIPNSEISPEFMEALKTNEGWQEIVTEMLAEKIDMGLMCHITENEIIIELECFREKITENNPACFVGIPDIAMTPKFIEKIMKDWNNKEIIYHDLFERMDGLECYPVAKNRLIKLGYTEAELSGINTLAAWDYGRTSFIARDSAKVGYLSEEEAWHYIKTAAENASKTYSGWREYIAAYIFGRAIGFGNDSEDLESVLDYVLNDDKSPIKTIPFKDTSQSELLTASQSATQSELKNASQSASQTASKTDWKSDSWKGNWKSK